MLHTVPWLRAALCSFIALAACEYESEPADKLNQESDGSGTCRNGLDCLPDERCFGGRCVSELPDVDASNRVGCLHGKSPTAAQPCTCIEDCDPGEVCVTELDKGVPGGVCLRGCPKHDCPLNLICIELTPGDFTTAACQLPCELTSDCPIGNVCQTNVSHGELFCSPYCQADGDCPATGKCDRYTGVCGDHGQHVGERDVGESCVSASDCRSDFCIPSSSPYPGGYCTAFCSLSRQGCPDGSYCVNQGFPVGDFGLCHSTCSDASECRSDYACVRDPVFRVERVCGPGA